MGNSYLIYCQYYYNVSLITERREKRNMHSVQVSKANGPLEIVEGRIPEPTAKQVRIRVQACGICHSDSIMKQGLFAGVTYTR
jgi:D-arabinose 1-dehydrogenase-like Zn-dependent alcohol dehydrogenase